MEKYDPILSERLKEERRLESQRNADKFFETFLNGGYNNLNLELDEEVKKFKKYCIKNNFSHQFDFFLDLSNSTG